MLALRSVAHLPVDGKVTLEANRNVLRINFSTIDDGGSAHEIYVPTIDVENSRSTAPFSMYEPAVVRDTELDYVEPGDDDVAGIEASILEMGGEA